MTRHHAQRIPSPQFQAGASLLEVLIAILVMSFGLLAMGGLTAATQQYVKMTQFQSIGMQLASEFGERMRGNVTGFESGLYTKTGPYSGTGATPKPCKAPCSPAEIAASDIAEWTNELQRRLPGGDGFVRRDAVNTLATDVWILWLDPELSDAGAPGGSVASASDCPEAALAGSKLSARPRCMHYRISL